MSESLPDIQELEGVIVDILSRTRNDGRLSQLTVRIVRQELATHFDLEQDDVLNSGKYKSFIKDTVHATVNSLQNASDEGVEPPQRKATKKEKSDGTTKTGSHKSKAQVHPSDNEPSDEANVSGGDAPPSKKASARSRLSKPMKSSKTSNKPESEVKYKSKAIIESSDEEPGTQKPACSPKKEQMSAKSSPPEEKQAPLSKKVDKNDSDVEMHTGESPGRSSSGSKPKRATQTPNISVSKPKQLTRDPMESDLSSVIDEPPKKRQKKQKKEKESVKPQKDEKTKRGKKEVLSKDEETVNKLKSMVVACGVRKVWKKEFEGLDKPSQQIKRLHSILGDLGMTPRYTLEKAKTLRERRELAQELEDVQEFEKGVTKRRGKGLRSSSVIEKSSDQGDSDADVPARKKKNARASIMAFLQDQSEEE